MSALSTPDRSFDSGTADGTKDRSFSTNISALQKARRGSRRDSVLPLCMSRDQQAAVQASGKFRKHHGGGGPSGKGRQHTPIDSSPTNNPNPVNGWMALLARPETNKEVSRALQMCSLYPTLRVAGTAFENSLNMAHRLSAESFMLLSRPRRATELSNGSFSDLHRDDVSHSPRMSTSVLMETSLVLREATEEWRTFHDAGNGGTGGGSGAGDSKANAHRRSSVHVPSSMAADAVSRTIALYNGTKMVQMACAMKRAAMWEVVVVTALAHRAMELGFRRDRLRRVLERHLLPTLMQRKRATGSVIAKKSVREAKRGSRDAAADAAMGSGAPQGSYLRDHDAFFASLNNSALLQSFAETMTRHRFLPGEVIARAGQLSQKSMYFLISGKCEVTKERSEVKTDAANPNETRAANNPSPGTPTYKDGMHSVKAPRLRLHGGHDAALSHCMKEVIMPGATFGGIFSGSSAVFAETYRALSQCIVWELRAEDFEQVFRPFADRVMLDKYKESMRAHALAWLQQHYHPSNVFGSIPVYRKLASRKPRYLADFTPVVKVRGELLFAQDDPPGDVYCLLEGTVLRRTKRTAGGEGVAQSLANNAFSAFRTVGRFLLLGEEPHILPGVQPYSCTISTRVALFYKIDGERFVNALLDDPVLYAQLRERLVKQREANMVLHPECLAYVPLLQRFPPEKRAELVQYAQPRVVGRSTSLCEPAQHLSELMLIVSGDVCDPRRYGQRPTASLRAPATCDADNAGGDDGGLSGSPARQVDGTRGLKRGQKDRRPRAAEANVSSMSANNNREAEGSGPTVARCRTGLDGHQPSGSAKGGLSFFNKEDTDDVDPHSSTPEAVGVDWSFSISEVPPSTMAGGKTMANVSFNSNNSGGELSGWAASLRGNLSPHAAALQLHQKLCQTAAIVYPDESEELNPPPPSQPSRGFLYALGGSWEALLLEKWPNGWETTSTVALWSIPILKIRIVYSSCAKPTQLYILNGLRLAQKEDQQLTSIPHTKMPPMTVYTQRVEAIVPGTVETGSQASSMASFKRRGAKKNPYEQRQMLHRGSIMSQSLPIPSDNVSFLFNGRDVSADAAAGDEDPLGDKKKPQRSAMGGHSNQNAVWPDASSAEKYKKKKQLESRAGAAATTTSSASKKATNGAPQKKVDDDTARNRTSERGKTGEHCGVLARRKARKAVASPSATSTAAVRTIDPAVKAAYEGVFDATDPIMLRIVRDPVVASAPGKNHSKSSARREVSPAGCTFPPIASDVVTRSFDSTITSASSAAWPAQKPARDRWFQAVPSYEPLPGTVRAAETLAAPPVFAPSSTVLASACIRSGDVHAKTLEGHVAYYAATASSNMASMVNRGEAAGDVSTGVTPHPLPKRRAYAA